MDKLIKKKITKLRISQPALLILSLCCAALPFFKPFDFSILMGRGAFALRGLSFFIFLLSILLSVLWTRVIYKYRLAIFIRFFEDAKIPRFLKIDANCAEKLYSEEEASAYKEKYENINKQLARINVFCHRFLIFEICTVFAIFILIEIKQFLQRETIFYSIYRISAFFIIFQTVSFAIFYRVLEGTLTTWIENLLAKKFTFRGNKST